MFDWLSASVIAISVLIGTEGAEVGGVPEVSSETLGDGLGFVGSAMVSI